MNENQANFLLQNFNEQANFVCVCKLGCNVNNARCTMKKTT